MSKLNEKKLKKYLTDKKRYLKVKYKRFYKLAFQSSQEGDDKGMNLYEAKAELNKALYYQICDVQRRIREFREEGVK